jgi:hypothetical protein
MNAHAAVLRYPRAPLAFRRAPLRSAPSRRRQAIALGADQYRSYLRVFMPGSTSCDSASSSSLWLALSRSFPALSQSFTSLFLAATKTWKAGTAVISRVPVNAKTASRLAIGALTGAMIILAIVNNERSKTDAIGFSPARNETVAYLHVPTQKSSIEDEGEPAADESEESVPLYYPRAVQTIKFVNPNSSNAATSAAARGPAAMTRVGGFVAFPGKQAADQTAAGGAEWPAFRRRKGAANMDEVDQYLWEVYQRSPTKRDHSGDFTWKDPAAANRMAMSLPEYVIGGMDPDFREQLYHAGHAMDAAGIQWSMLSAFRDDYRQRLAKGFKAKVGRSLHGGSRATGGYGNGRAVDVTNADGDADVVWQWLDANGGRFGLHRPIPGPDPAHVQSRGEWHKLALALRESRLRAAGATGTTNRETPAARAKVAKASL